MAPFQGAPLVLLAAVLSSLLAGWVAEAALDIDALELVWFDDFEGDSVDWDKWIVDEGDGCDVGLCDWGNGEKQYYRSENAAVENGELTITAKEETYSSRFYTSSKLTTKNHFSFRYGRAEARLRMSEGGQGLWPAFWMMPQDNVYGQWAASGEIDILESRNNLTEVTNNLNFGNAFPNNSNNNGECTRDVDAGTLQEFHTYALEWDADEIIWFMDDEETCRQDEWFSTDVKTGEARPKPAPFDQEFYLVLNVAVGGNADYVGDGPVDDSALPAEMVVEWVKVFQTPKQFGEGSQSVYLRDATGGGALQGVLLWEDEFNGTEVSGDWEIETGDVCVGATSLCTNEVQEFDAASVAVGGGVLNLTAVALSMTATGVSSAASGMLNTKGGFSFTYGRLEANLSLPSEAGVVSTVSLLPTAATSIGQVTVVAAENGSVAGWLYFSEGDSGTGSSEFACAALPPIGAGASGSYEEAFFYTFAVEWTEDRFRWYADGRQYCEVTKLQVEESGGIWVFDEEMYVSVGLTVGRALGGGVVAAAASPLPWVLSVGSIRAYQYAGADGSHLEAPIPSDKYVLGGNLTWQDEFDGLELDAASQEAAGEGILGLEYWWQHEEGDGCEMGICGFGNGEAQWYRKENAGVRDGKLVITAKAEPYAGNIYTSSKLSTNTSVVISYGRIEVRAKLPSAQGLWPSIWMLPQDSPYGGWASGGAIDILQARNLMTRVHAQLVFGGDYPDVANLDLYEGGHCFSDLVGDFSEDYHVFAVEWEVDSFKWYIDGILYCDRDYWYSRPGPGEADYPFPAPFDTGFYLIMNVAVGGSFTGGLIDEDALAENPEMLVDYVRIYTLEGQSVFVADPPDQGSSGGGGSVLSVVTAVSVLVVLAVLFSLCLIVNCIAKRMTGKNANAGDITAASRAGGGSGDGAFNGSENGDVRLPMRLRPAPAAPAASAATTAAGSRNKGAIDKRYGIGGGSGVAGGGVGGGGLREKRMSALTPSGNGGAVPLRGGGVGGAAIVSRSHSALSSTGLTPPLEEDGGECDSSGGSSVGIGGGIIGDVGVGLPTKSPLWGRSTGASETRVDVTPGRLRRGAGGGDEAVSGRSERVRLSRPRPPSGSIPETWVEDDDDDDSGGVIEAGAGERAWARDGPIGGGGGRVGGGSGSVGVSGVDVEIDEDVPLGGDGGGGGGGGVPYDEAVAYSDVDLNGSDDGGVPYDEAVAYVDGGGGGGFDDDGVGNDYGDGGRRGMEARGGVVAGPSGAVIGGGGGATGSGRFSGYLKSASVCSEESVLPPTMAGLTLDKKTMEDEENFDNCGLPSYDQATAPATRVPHML